MIILIAYNFRFFSANGLSKYYVHQISCYLSVLFFVPSQRLSLLWINWSSDVLLNDISAKHPGYACVLANALEAPNWIL